ncbi:MAG: hypothetical protein GY765_24010 [bacterium]|nr:hypothetical protein [bacterium]
MELVFGEVEDSLQEMENTLREVETIFHESEGTLREVEEIFLEAEEALREIEEMKRLMQQVPIVKYQVMAYYQQVKEEQKEIIHRQLESGDTVGKELQTPPAPIYQEPEVPVVLKPKAPEAPAAPEVREAREAREVVLPKEPGKPAAALHTEQGNREPINEEREMQPAVILKETETPDTLNNETAKPARAKVQNLFPKKRKKKPRHAGGDTATRGGMPPRGGGCRHAGG